MNQPIDLNRLSDFFASEDIEWKPMRVSPDGSRALAAAYLTNRAIMDRLDAVCGRAHWVNQYKAGPDGGVICGLSIRIDGEWVTKWDGAENTDVEPVKGGLSSSMRRAAVQWGIGRYLYRLPAQWVDIDERGRFRQPPQLDPAFLPAHAGDGGMMRPVAPAVPTQQAATPAAAPSATPEVARAVPTPASAQNARAPQRRLAANASVPQDPARVPQAPRAVKPKQPKQRGRSDADQYFMPRDLPF